MNGQSEPRAQTETANARYEPVLVFACMLRTCCVSRVRVRVRVCVCACVRVRVRWKIALMRPSQHDRFASMLIATLITLIPIKIIFTWLISWRYVNKALPFALRAERTNHVAIPQRKSHHHCFWRDK